MSKETPPVGETKETAPDAGTGTASPSGEVKFTDEQQKIVDSIVQKRLSRVKTEHAETVEQLKQLQRNRELSEEEREKLQGQISSLEKSVLTKEELAARERKEADEKHQQTIQNLQDESKAWRQRFEESTIVRSLTDAAVVEESFSPSQIVALLQGQTQLVEDTVDGKGTGTFSPRVKFMGRDSDGKSMEMDLTVSEAVKEMKKMDDKYGNLFKSGLTAGIGKTNTAGDGPLSADVLLSQEAYDKARERIKEIV